jgi:cyanophycinase
MKPKGKLLLIGGAEYKGNDHKLKDEICESDRFSILNELLYASQNNTIEIITTGSQVQHEVKKDYQRAFRRIGYPHVGFMDINDKMEARNPKYLERAEKAGAIFFSGGDQFRLSTILGGTPIIDIIKKRYCEETNFLLAGTSAGAMASGSVMIIEGGVKEALFGRDLRTAGGLGFIQNCIIDTHFIKRGRFGRLAHAIIMNPDLLGIGLGEDTALIIKNGYDAECRGSGMVVIIDGRYIEQTNITEAENKEPIFVENLKVHLLVRGCRFSIKTRKLAKPAIRRHHKKC